MPFMLILVGLVLVITSLQNTHAALGAQLGKDFFGPQGFVVWMLALIAVGALGYVSGWEKFSRWFLALILLAIVLAQSKRYKSNTGLFGSLLEQIKNPKAPPAAATTAPSSAWASNGATGDANPMNRDLWGQSSQGWLGDQSKANNFFNSIAKMLTGGYSR